MKEDAQIKADDSVLLLHNPGSLFKFKRGLWGLQCHLFKF